MLFRLKENLMPKKQIARVALKLFASQKSLLRLGVKQKRFRKKFSRLTKLVLVSFLVLYLMGYQPIWAIPPVKKSQALAQFSQQQDLQAGNFSEPFNLPHPGYLTSVYSKWHPGVDIATGFGMPIHPIAKGQVVEVTTGFWGFGHYVIVEHEQKIRSTYAHMGRIFVHEGDIVSTMSTLGLVGMTGHTSGPHTHLEITRDGQNIDPMILLPAVPDYPAYQQTLGGKS